MLRSLLPLSLLISACGAKPAPPPVVIAPVPSPSTSSAPVEGGSCVEAIAVRVDIEWGTPDAPKFSFAGQVADVSKRVQSYDKQRRAFVDELRPFTTGALPCAAAAHVEIGVVDDVFRSAVLASKLDPFPPEAAAKIEKIESDAHKVLSDPKSTPENKENARSLLEKTQQIRANGAEMGRTALHGWSAYAEMELIESYARGLVEARKAGVKGSTYANAWKRMGVLASEVPEEKFNERLEPVKKEHPDVPLDASGFRSPCTWPAGC